MYVQKRKEDTFRLSEKKLNTNIVIPLNHWKFANFRDKRKKKKEIYNYLSTTKRP